MAASKTINFSLLLQSDSLATPTQLVPDDSSVAAVNGSTLKELVIRSTATTSTGSLGLGTGIFASTFSAFVYNRSTTTTLSLTVVNAAGTAMAPTIPPGEMLYLPALGTLAFTAYTTSGTADFTAVCVGA